MASLQIWLTELCYEQVLSTGGSGKLWLFLMGLNRDRKDASRRFFQILLVVCSFQRKSPRCIEYIHRE
ncbi:hypothetical protein ACSTDY_04540 [Vibrio vulnificus]|uniref:hypothetical protein n=1 Tax=Vibrio vulnificus TaxID=672 RepID=UPI003ED9BF77